MEKIDNQMYNPEGKSSNHVVTHNSLNIIRHARPVEMQINSKINLCSTNLAANP